MRRIIVTLLAVAGILSSCGREKLSFDDLINLIDGELTLGALHQADRNIREAASRASGRSEWLSLLKRAYTLGESSNSFETLYITAKEALSDISGAEEIAALSVFSALRTGKYEIAYQYAEEHLISEQWSALRSEAVLRRRGLSEGVLTTSAEESSLLNAVFSGEPSALARAAGLFDDSRFGLVAALRYAAEGQVRTAADIISPYVTEYSEVAMLLFYDAGLYKRAGELASSPEFNKTSRSADMDLLRADTFIRLKDLASAIEVYEELIESFPVHSWIPYVNTAVILTARGDREDAVDILAAGKHLFPDVRQILLTEIFMSAGADEEKALMLIDRYTLEYPEDPEIAVLIAGVYPSEPNRIRLENALWNTFLENPEHSRAARYLAASLLASGDVDGLLLLIEVWERENGTTDWSYFMRGYHALMEQTGDAAAEAFEKSFQLSPRWETAFNLGVIAQRTAEYDLAIDYFRNAEMSIPLKSSQIDATRGLIRGAVARVLYERGDYDSALREAKYALDLDRGASEAALLIDLLEQRTN